MGSLIFSYIRRHGSFLGVQNIEFNYLFFFFLGGGGFRKMNIFWSMKILLIFLGFIIKLDYIQGSFLCI